MKTYIFEQGKLNTENLSGSQIRENEKKLGRLIKVVIGTKIIPVDYRDNQIPVTEHAWYKRREKERETVRKA